MIGIVYMIFGCATCLCVGTIIGIIIGRKLKEIE